jgi:hypothetical protein
MIAVIIAEVLLNPQPPKGKKFYRSFLNTVNFNNFSPFRERCPTGREGN